MYKFYLKHSRESISSNGIIFLQETHFSSKDGIKWKGEFQGELYFSHGKTNSCAVGTGYTGTNLLKFEIEKWSKQ